MTGAPVSDPRPVLITGGAGFIGANIADRIASQGGQVRIYDALVRPGVEHNLARLVERHGSRVEAIKGDVRDRALLASAMSDCHTVFHMAAQVAVTTSLDDPVEDFSVNVMGTVNVLEAARTQAKPPSVLFASTNKVYGSLDDIELVCGEDGYAPTDPHVKTRGISEERALDFHTPYGCSKGAADQYVLDYARSFGLQTAVMRMSCIYGPWQMGTEDQGWVAHFVIRALQKKPITLYGDGKQVRDILYVDDAVDAYLAAASNIGAVRGRAFNLGGGVRNAVSIETILRAIAESFEEPVATMRSEWRTGDQRYYVSDTSRVRAALGLPEPRSWRQGLPRLIDWLKKQNGGSTKASRMEMLS